MDNGTTTSINMAADAPPTAINTNTSTPPNLKMEELTNPPVFLDDVDGDVLVLARQVLEEQREMFQTVSLMSNEAMESHNEIKDALKMNLQENHEWRNTIEELTTYITEVKSTIFKLKRYILKMKTDWKAKWEKIDNFITQLNDLNASESEDSGSDNMDKKPAAKKTKKPVVMRHGCLAFKNSHNIDKKPAAKKIKKRGADQDLDDNGSHDVDKKPHVKKKKLTVKPDGRIKCLAYKKKK